jgi:DNA-binding beta-propeller fold protein YncE
MKALPLLLTLLSCVACIAEPLQLVTNVPLPGVKGRFDHFAVDTNTQRLFLAALGNNTLEVVGLDPAKRLHTITGLHKPTGVAFVGDVNRLFVANGDDGTLKVFDGTSYGLLKSIAGLDDADNVRYDGKARLLYVGYGDGALGVINVQKLEQTGSIKLKAHPEAFQLERNGTRIFVNVPDTKQIAVVDRDNGAVIATWPMEKFQANFPMALDETGHRLFIGCRQPARVLVVDTTNGQSVTDFAITGDTDDLFWDEKRDRLYVSGGAGFLDSFSRSVPDGFARIAHDTTAPGARTSFFSSALNVIAVAVPARGAQAAEVRLFRPQ